MRKLLLAPLLAVALTATSACDTFQTGMSPAPLLGTTADEKALSYAWESYDFVLTSVDLARDAGKIVPGTAKAKTVQGFLITIRDALNAASAARKAGNVTSYQQAFDEAQVALKNV